MYIHPNPPWRKLKPTDEKIYWNRRQIIKSLGLASGGILASPALLSACTRPTKNTTEGLIDDSEEQLAQNYFTFDGIEDYFPATRNKKYVLDRELTGEYHATHKNNFYEFINKNDPSIYNAYKYVAKFDNRDWKFEITGLAGNKGTFYLEEMIKKFGQEERTYRFRCVERWAMAVPWTGIPFSKFVKFLEPDSKAKYIRMTTFADKDQMIGVKDQPWYPWPYFEGLRMDEALNELAFLATGLYGKPLPKQNGAPMRLVVPWKYGYKNIKSIIRFEFIEKEPETFWHKIAPSEYGFFSNINPEIPHPRWSQAMEQMIPDGDWIPTMKYGGYGDYVAKMYG